MPFDMKVESETVPLETIDFRDQTYRVSQTAGPSFIHALADSIDRVGMLHTPLIAEKNGQGQIVSGFRRMAACQRLGRDQVLCRVAGPETTNRTNAQMAVAENAWQRPLNLMEKARAFALLQQWYPDPKNIADVAHPLGLAENPEMIGKLIRLVKLPVSVQAAVETELLGLAMALTLGTLETKESEQILKLFQTFRFGLNRQREMLTLIQEIAKRESITIAQVLASDQIITILNRSDQDRPTRGGALRHYLKNRRYPMLTKKETEFVRLEQKLGLGSRARIVPPPYFEGRTYQVTMKFDTIKELKTHRQMIDRMVRHPDLKVFLDR